MKQLPIDKAPKFLISKIVSHGFLQEDDVQILFPHKLLDLGFLASPAKTPHIPACGLMRADNHPVGNPKRKV
jgi:hypothetical protein